MAVFSFRAECEHDMATFANALRAKGIAFEMDVSNLPLMVRGELRESPDMKAELKADMTLREVRLAMAEQEDAHVMIQSLRELPLSENHLGRDNSINWFDKDSF